MKKVVWLGGVICLVLFGFVTFRGVWVSAIGEVTEPSFINSASLENAAPLDFNGCSDIEGNIDVQGSGKIDRACIFGNTSTIRLARFGSQYAIAFPNSNQFYEYRSGCLKLKCAYAPATDTFIHHKAHGVYLYGAELYKKFSKHLKRHFDFGTMKTYYRFEPSEPANYSVKIGEHILATEAVAFSENGKYAVVEVQGRGILRIDTETFDTRRVAALQTSYGLFNDPHYEMAISNDGTTLFTAGYRAGTLVYFIDNSCGDRLEILSQYLSPGSTPCKQVSLNLNRVSSSIYQTFNPKINSLGSRLSVSVLNNDGSVKRVTFSIGSERHALSYLALGDSYTSGEGEEKDTFYMHKQVGGDRRCHVSARSYPHLLAKQWKVVGQNIACSGAKTVDILGGESAYLGQSKILEGLDNTSVFAAKEVALARFQPGVIPQMSFVSEYQPKVVSVGIGGNDAGLVSKLSSCLGFGICEWVKDPYKKSATAKEIAAVYPKVRDILKRIRQDSPASKVVVVGYPQIIEISESAQCGAIISTVLEKEERQFIAESIRYLNAVIKAAAHAERVSFADVSSALRDRMLCNNTKPSAMNAIRFGDDVAPLAILKDFRVFGAESFHPTPYGHSLVSAAIAQTYPAIDSLTSCDDCYESEIPDPSEYWLTPGLQPSNTEQRHEIFTDKNEYRPESEVKLLTSFMQFMPKSDVTVEINSRRTYITDLTTDDDGRLIGLITLPKSIEPGYHTLHLYGSTHDGKSVDVYQSIAVALPVEPQSNDTVKGQVDSGSFLTQYSPTQTQPETEYGGVSGTVNSALLNPPLETSRVESETLGHATPGQTNDSMSKAAIDDNNRGNPKGIRYWGLIVLITTILLALVVYGIVVIRSRYSQSRTGRV